MHWSVPGNDQFVFCANEKYLSTSKRIGAKAKRALDDLRQRDGVSGGLTSEPKIAKIRTGPRVEMSVDSLKVFNLI